VAAARRVDADQYLASLVARTTAGTPMLRTRTKDG